MSKDIVVITGAAGFIGSVLLKYLNQKGIEQIICVDHLSVGAQTGLDNEKWKNLYGKKFIDYIEKDDFLQLIEKDKLPSGINAIIHLGACTSTVEKDVNYMIKNNFLYTKRIAEYCISKNIFLIYASSAATYGNGENGFVDDESKIFNLKPLNIYGFSKHLFDMLVVNNDLWRKHFCGLKFFNVYGPNEYHKGEMKSVINKMYYQIKNEGKVSLFKSYKDNFKNGEQKRDFVYVKDVVDVIYFFFENRKSGIYNVGTGKAVSFNEVAETLFSSLGIKKNIEYIEMPENIRPNYQYFTQADISKLRKAGYRKEFTSIEKGVSDYVKYLENKKYE